MVAFYVRDWLSASAGVGFLKVLKESGYDPKDFKDGNTIKFSEDFLSNILPEIFAEQLLKTSGSDKFTGVLMSLKDFYSNSILTNPSGLSSWVKGREGNLDELVKGFVKEKFSELLSYKPSNYTCFFCGERKAYIDKKKRIRVFDATNFTPLSASPETVENFYYNGKNNLYLCAVCEIMFYFSKFGFTKLAGNRYLFVYTPDLETTFNWNQELQGYGRITKDFMEKTLAEFVKGVEERKAYWILSNIYFVEIEIVGDAKANVYSFSLPQRVARAIRKLINSYPENFNHLLGDFLKYVYSGKNLYNFLLEILYGYFHGEDMNRRDLIPTFRAGFDLKNNLGYLPRSLLYFAKFQEVLDMREDYEKYIGWAYREGRELRKTLEGDLGEEKAKDRVQVISYRILEAIRRKDVDAFQQNLIRAYLTVEREIPYLFVEALKSDQFNRIAYAFLIGLNGGRRDEGSGEEAR